MTRHLIFGDIHGCYDELVELCSVAAVSADDVLVSVGDLVDRGPDPTRVVRFFRERAGAVVLMGNHERKHVRQVLSYSQEVTRLQMGADYQDSVAWMQTLPYWYATEHVRVVHAALVPGIALADQREDVLAGTTSGETFLASTFGERFWHEHYSDPVPVAFGHHVVGPEPLVREGQVYGLDTGVCHGLRLTALSVPDFRIHSVPARADHWETVKRQWQGATLRARPFASMSWKKIDEVLAERGVSDVPEVVELVAAIREWVGNVRGLVSALEARVPTLTAELREQHGASFEVAIEPHPAKALLFACAKKRFDRRAIESRCPTPEATLALARKLGVDVALLEDVPTAKRPIVRA